MSLKLCALLLFINFGLLQAYPDITAAVEIPRGPLVPDNIIIVQGIVDPKAKSFIVNLQQGGGEEPQNVGLYIEVDLEKDTIVLSALKDGTWLKKDTKKYENVVEHDHPDTSFEIVIKASEDNFAVNINSHRVEFPYLVSLDKLDHVVAKGDVDIESVVIKSVSKDDLQTLDEKK